MAKVVYNFSDPIFEKNFLYKRLAKEHLLLLEIESTTIRIEVAGVRGPLKIPDTYNIHFNVRSIVGINDDESPIYGNHHIVELHLPLKFPMESPRIYMKTDAWHPNIKWDGKFKGRICGNTRDFGKGFDLTQLVFRIGEILQYKNYHADNTPPFPEDSMVAKWVKEYAEPNDIVNKYKDIVVDTRELTDNTPVSEPVANEVAEVKTDHIAENAEPEAPSGKLRFNFNKTNTPEASDEKKIKFKSR